MKTPLPLTHRDQLPSVLTHLNLTNEICEVGVFEGEFADHLLTNWQGVRLVGCDPFFNYSWKDYRDGCNKSNMEAVMTTALRRLAKHGSRFELLREESPTAAEHFPIETFDCVYIDANHRYENAKADIEAWWPKVRKMGILGGHDYYEREDAGQLCGVKRAVDEFVKLNELPLITTTCTSWFVRKPGYDKVKEPV